MSSSGLIYAVIVGAWAAYLVPMWLRRQDELNEARPTERFSTAIRLLSGKAAMERRYAKDAERRGADGTGAEEAGEPSGAAGASGVFDAPGADLGDDDVDTDDPDEPADNAVDVRAFAEPRTMIQRAAAAGAESAGAELAGGERAGGERAGAERSAAARASAERNKRARVLARRRRTTMLLFLAFTLGTVAAAVGGLALLWAPAVPAVLLSAYIVHLRAQERRRFTFTMDRRRAEEAARQLRERRPRDPAAARERAPEQGQNAAPASASGSPSASAAAAASAAEAAPAPAPQPAPRAVSKPAPAAAPSAEQSAARQAAARQSAARQSAARQQSADRRALVERTDHAEWVDQERGRVREQPEAEPWDPVPVPLPTYVSAPVAPRTARGVDLDAPDTWSSARSSTAGTPGTPGTPGSPSAQSTPDTPDGPSARRPATPPARERTPLFDQYADDDRPRAANE